MRTQISAQFGCKLYTFAFGSKAASISSNLCNKTRANPLLVKLPKERARPHVREPKEKSRAPQGQELKVQVTTQNQPL